MKTAKEILYKHTGGVNPLHLPQFIVAMEEYAAQFKPEPPPCITAEEVPYMSPQDFFNAPDGMFTLDFLTEEERETLYAAIELYVIGRLRFAASQPQQAGMRWDKNKLFENARFYAEQRMGLNWDRYHAETVGVFYKYFIDHLYQSMTESAPAGEGYSREEMIDYGKQVLKSISDTFLKPENLSKASLNDQVVIQAVGETILNFPLPAPPDKG